MPYVMRAVCYCYGSDDPEDRDNPRRVGYVRKDGQVVRNRAEAYVYETEEEAWEHAKLADLTGEGEDGPFCWTEEVP